MSKWLLFSYVPSQLLFALAAGKLKKSTVHSATAKISMSSYLLFIPTSKHSPATGNKISLFSGKSWET